MLACLGVAKQMVEERGVHCPEKLFQRGAKARLRRRALVLAHAVQGEQLFKVHAPELWSTVYGDSCGKSPVPLDTQPHHHHTGAVGRRIEGQVERSNAPGIRKDHEREPAFAQELVCLGIAELEIDFQMVDMCHRPGVTAMSIDRFFRWMVIFFERVSGSRPFTYKHLFIDSLVALCLLVKGALGDGWQMFLFGLCDVLAVGSPFGLARERVVVCREDLLNEGNDLSARPSFASSTGKVWKQANVATAAGDFCLPVPLSPTSLRSFRNGHNMRCKLYLLIIMILLRMNDPVAEGCGCKIHVPCQV